MAHSTVIFIDVNPAETEIAEKRKQNCGSGGVEELVGLPVQCCRSNESVKGESRCSAESSNHKDNHYHQKCMELKRNAAEDSRLGKVHLRK